MASNANPNAMYQVVSRRSPSELELFVNQQLRAGWLPLGGISVVVQGGTTCWAQALTRNVAEADAVTAVRTGTAGSQAKARPFNF